MKSFASSSTISEFHTALGQFLNYPIAIETSDEPQRILYLAVPKDAYQNFFRFEPAQTAIKRYDSEAQLIFDPVRDRYLVMHNNWRGESRIYGCAMQLDIIEDQIWIQHNTLRKLRKSSGKIEISVRACTKSL